MRAVATIFISSCLSVHLVGQTVDLLDLTQPKPSIKPEVHTRGTVSAGGPSSNAVREQAPIRLSLNWIDRQTFRDGEMFVFRVGILNSGGAPIVLPWEPDSDRVINDGTNPLKAAIVIDAKAQDHELTIPIATLFGAKNDPSSIKVLRPGERVEIMAKGRWRLVSPFWQPPFAIALPTTVDIGARMILASNVDNHFYKDVTSTNRVPIVIQERAHKR